MTDAELGRFLLALVSLLTFALLFGRLSERLAMPPVMGEIAAGLLLGPSILGLLLPGVHEWLFTAFPAQGALLASFYWMGLILLMFVAGFRVQREMAAEDRGTVLVLLAASLILPMFGGWHLTTIMDQSRMMAPGAPTHAFHLVLAIAAAVTSIPVISRIFLDLGLMDTRFAKVILMTATLQDLVLWTALAVATGIASGQGTDQTNLGQIVATTIIFMGVAVLAGPALLTSVGRRAPIRRDTPALVGYALVACLALATAASLLRINVIFGALAAGIIVGALPHERLKDAKQRISDIALWFFVPLYFAIVGLKIDLARHFGLEQVVIFIAATSILKFASCAVALRLAGRPVRACVDYGVAMNTRGGPGIVLASVALAYGVITETFFVTLVMASLLTSLFSGAWLRAAVRGGISFDARPGR